MKFRTGGGIHRIEQDQRHRQRDDTQIHVADAPVEHEIAKQRGEARRQRDRQQKRERALADIEHGDRIGIGAQPEEGRLAETENAAVPPDQRQAEREDRHDHVDRKFEHGIELGETRRQDQEGDTDDADQSKTEKIEGAGAHRPLRK